MILVPEYAVSEDELCCVQELVLHDVLVESESARMYLDSGDDKSSDLIISFSDEDDIEIEAIALTDIPQNLSDHVLSSKPLGIRDIANNRVLCLTLEYQANSVA